MNAELQEFLAESDEMLDQFDRELSACRTAQAKGQPVRAILDSAFRALHTIKGTAGFFDLVTIEGLAHVVEQVLDRLRSGKLDPHPVVLEVLYQSGVELRRALAQVEATGVDATKDPQLLATLARLVSETPDLSTLSIPSPQIREVSATPTMVAEDPESRDEGRSIPFGDLLIQRGLVKPEDVVLALKAQRKGDPRHLGELLVARGLVSPEQVVRTLESQEPRGDGEADGREGLFVEATLFEHMRSLVADLVLTRNKVDQRVSDEDRELWRATRRLNMITAQLQESMLRARAQPVSQQWSKFPKLARQVANRLGKQVSVEIEGGDTRLDKTLLDALRDPLTHAVRNAVDHGLEHPDDRAAAGKPREGWLRLRAAQDGGRVRIDVIDDGAGVDVDRVRERAVERGIVGHDQVLRMSDDEVVQLVFEPGFSTAQQVSAVSGRGVGMDVVKNNVESIGGLCRLSSRRGQGSTLSIVVPLTHAIIPVLLVQAGGQTFAIPQSAVAQLIRLTDARVASSLERVGEALVCRVRDQVIPVIDVANTLGMPATCVDASTVVNLVVVNTGGHELALLVESVEDVSEVVVDRLKGSVRELAVYAGAAVLGDGRLALLLDLSALAAYSGVEEATAEELRMTDDSVASAPPERVLVVAAGKHRMATSIERVLRVDEITRSRVEMTAIGPVVQKDGRILPLKVLRGRPLKDNQRETLTVLVCDGRRGRIGIVVDEVHEVHPLPPPAANASTPDHTVVLAGKVTDLFDVRAV